MTAKERKNNLNIIKKEYQVDEINKTLGKINDQIETYRKIYRTMPTFIIISNELQKLLSLNNNLMGQYESIFINGGYLVANRIFGIICFVTPTLKDLEFEIR